MRGGGSKLFVSLMKVKPAPNRLFSNINFARLFLPGDFRMRLKHHLTLGKRNNRESLKEG
jgi:hypothetical protein